MRAQCLARTSIGIAEAEVDAPLMRRAVSTPGMKSVGDSERLLCASDGRILPGPDPWHAPR